MKCIYHNADMDGRCSAALIKYVYPECQLIGTNHGYPIPWELFKENEDETVFVVDFCLPEDDMVRLADMCRGLIWIDHHKTPMEAMDARRDFRPYGRLTEVGRSGCELTLEWLRRTDSIKVRGDLIYRIVRLLGRYDVWKWEGVEGAIELQKGIWLYDHDPSNQEFWRDAFCNGIFQDEMIEQGKVILLHEKQKDEAYARVCAMEVMLDGLRCIAINKGMCNSQVFDTVYDRGKHDAMLLYNRSRRHWKYSLYSETTDVSVVCKARGGGGHKGASGFQSEFLLPELGGPISDEVIDGSE